ncbi:DUF4344 domain-containing metallopeptidase [Labrenzia sp. 011]|uniref:DUF4344 domain-containing metallopeptidase n=1 Tax=Labrenzia sp. 011 TaxID=2171494 RepID=UPI000D50B98D|nr:DUF4344 domain-containing metallopeptidase [Labrenzia sp. 011]PVB63405.1 hypothetical protein DCO57_00905 [Labrenzia sp. 011]
MTGLAAISGRLATRVSGAAIALFCLSAAPIQTGAQANETPYATLEEELAELSAGAREELLLFVAGNALHTLYHEGGHMLISQLELPVLGREEDAVDNLATIAMLETDTDDMDLLLTHAMIGRFLIAEDNNNTLVFHGEHDLDLRRGFTMLCLMVGADEEAFRDHARDLGLPEERIETCAFAYKEASVSWQAATEPFIRESDVPAGRTRTVHDPAPEGLKILAQFLEKSELVEDVAREFDTLYDLPADVTFRTTACGVENAFWDPGAREVTLCHELLGAFADLYLGMLVREE